MNTDVFSEKGKSLVNKKGELVCKSAFPSMPIYFGMIKIIKNISQLILKNTKMFGIMEIMQKEKLTVDMLFMEDQMQHLILEVLD